MSERTTTEEAMTIQFMNLLKSYKKVYVTLARAELRAETRNLPIAYESGVKRSLEIMERSGFLIGQGARLEEQLELDERGILRD
jgi:hypothetical protein|tara:strand:+ start:149 stop:400 length:252 start_codon:yes stop_codon:yes gene_type:complete